MTETLAATNLDALNEPLVLRNGAVLKNRLAKAALSESLSRRDHTPGARIKGLYRRWSNNGLGLVITGNVMVDRRAIGEPGNVVVEDDSAMADLIEWAQIIKSGGAAAWAQINHPGRQAPRTLTPQPVAPSAVSIGAGTSTMFAEPRALTGPEIEDIIRRFATTAGVLVRAGFDGVQIHGAHGYLVSQFLSPLANQRTDEWGGSPENRRRFVIELVRAMRAEIGEAALGIKLNSADFQRGGFTEDESIEVVRALVAEGIDLLEISGGTYASAAMLGVDPTLKESTRQREAYFLDYALKVRAEFPELPLMLTGGFRTAEAMNDAVATGAVDLVGLGRPLAVEPDVPAQLLTGAAPGSHVKPRRSGIRLIDSLTELTAYTVQLWRMADGREPAPRRHPAFNVAQYMFRSGVDSVRVGRRGL